MKSKLSQIIRSSEFKIGLSLIVFVTVICSLWGASMGIASLSDSKLMQDALAGTIIDEAYFINGQEVFPISENQQIIVNNESLKSNEITDANKVGKQAGNLADNNSTDKSLNDTSGQESIKEYSETKVDSSSDSGNNNTGSLPESEKDTKSPMDVNNPEDNSQIDEESSINTSAAKTQVGNEEQNEAAEEPQQQDTVEIKGKVVDEDNNPVEGVIATLSFENASFDDRDQNTQQSNNLYSDETKISTQTLTDGTFVFVSDKGVSANISFEKEGYDSKLALLSKEDLTNDYEMEDVTLQKEISQYSYIKCNRVFDAISKLPVVGADVTFTNVLGDSYSTKTGENGTFSLMVENGIKGEIKISKDSYEKVTFENIKTYEDLVLDDISMTLQMMKITLKGKVVNTSNQPLKSCTVYFEDILDNVVSTSTNANGEFSLYVNDKASGSINTSMRGYIDYKKEVTLKELAIGTLPTIVLQEEPKASSTTSLTQEEQVSSQAGEVIQKTESMITEGTYTRDEILLSYLVMLVSITFCAIGLIIYSRYCLKHYR